MAPAQRIDGCNDFQKHRYVSIPGLRPQIVFVFVISSLAALKVFDEIYVLTNRTGGTSTASITAPNEMITVLDSARETSPSTGRLVCSETPRSPVTARISHLAYCTGIG